MRREELKWTCDLCLDEIGEEVPAISRIRLLTNAGRVRALDLCDTHDGDVHPSELEKLATAHGTILPARVISRGRIKT